MIFGEDRNELRTMYKHAWARFCDQAPLTPLDAQIAAVVEWHPEYHADVEGDDLNEEYTAEGGKTNPFLHMGLHLGIREQVATDRPAGIRSVFASLSDKIGNAHDTEHKMIDCLAETLWEAQRQNSVPDEQKYIARLRKLIHQGV